MVGGRGGRTGPALVRARAGGAPETRRALAKIGLPAAGRRGGRGVAMEDCQQSSMATVVGGLITDHFLDSGPSRSTSVTTSEH